MAQPSALLIIFSSVALVFGHLYPAFETTRGLWTAAPGEERKILTKDRDRQQRSAGSPEDDPECQEGNPLDASYSGKVSHTISGRSCQARSSSQPHEPKFTDVGKVGDTEAGDHNFCRNPDGNLGGVWCYTTALCCYPNVNGAIRNLSLNTPTATIFLQFNYFRENIWVRIWVQFHFFYIFVGRVERIYKTSHITMLSFYFFPSDLQSFGDELNRSSKTAHA